MASPARGLTRVEILSEPFDPLREVAAQRNRLPPGAHGACALFTGDMRSHRQGVEGEITKLHLEHYPEMTERHSRGIAETARERWDVLSLILLHRVGDVRPGETIVLSGAWAAHRAEAFAAARFMIEDLKSKAPFWKKEYTADGEAWVSENTPPDADAEAWAGEPNG